MLQLNLALDALPENAARRGGKSPRWIDGVRKRRIRLAMLAFDP